MTLISIKIFFVFLTFAAIGQCIINLPLKKGKIPREVQAYTRKSYLRSSLTNKLVNFQDDIYFAEVQVGKSKKPFEVVFDTGSEIFWIPSAQCDTCKQVRMKSYDCIEEDECIPTDYVAELQYATRYTAGNITHFNVGIPGTENAEYFGISVSYVTDIPSGFDAFDVDETASKTHSAITFGGFGESKIVGKVQYFKNVKENAWFIPFEEFEVDDVKVYTEKGSALIDTGTTSFYLRTDITEKYFDNIQKRGIKIGDECDVSCDSEFPKVSFSLRNIDGELIKFEIEPSFYVTPSITKKNFCYLYFEGLIRNRPQMVIGNTVLRKSLRIFDYENKTMGLSRTINQPPRTYPSKSEQ
ncbi:hypothetical protein ABPG72_016623 [Tetrahymena utriculariae]